MTRLSYCGQPHPYGDGERTWSPDDSAVLPPVEGDEGNSDEENTNDVDG